MKNEVASNVMHYQAIDAFSKNEDGFLTINGLGGSYGEEKLILGL